MPLAVACCSMNAEATKGASLDVIALWLRKASLICSTVGSPNAAIVTRSVTAELVRSLMDIVCAGESANTIHFRTESVFAGLLLLCKHLPSGDVMLADVTERILGLDSRGRVKYDLMLLLIKHVPANRLLSSSSTPVLMSAFDVLKYVSSK